MNDPLDLSIIIVNWNTRDLLLRCLGAIYENLKGLDFEVIVIDNGSEDDSVDALRRAFPRVKVFVNEHNLGYSKAANQGLKEACGRYLVLLNTDAIVTVGALEEMTRVMDENEDAGLAGGLLLNDDGSAQNSFAAFPSLLSELTNKSLLRIIWPRKFGSKSRGSEEPFDVDSLIGACLMIRARAAAEVGYLDEDYFFFQEETDWAKRMHLAGWRVIHIPRARIYHLQGRSAAKMPLKSRIEFYRSRYTFFRKWYGSGRASILKAGLLLRLMIEILLSFLYNLLTLFLLKKEVLRLRLRFGLLLWHLLGSPADWGLERRGPS